MDDLQEDILEEFVERSQSSTHFKEFTEVGEYLHRDFNWEEKLAAWKAANPEVARSRSIATTKEWRKNNKAHATASKALWRANNIEKARAAGRRHSQTFRDKKKGESDE